MRERRYPATLVRVVDGDTLDLTVDLGFRVMAKQRFRLVGIDCPELPGPAGVAAAEFATGWLHSRTVGLEVESQREDIYARWLGVVWAGPESLNGALVAAGHATARLTR